MTVRTPHWPIEPGSGRGRSHGTSGTEPFDRWFRYPAGFASDYVGMLLDRLDLGEGTVVDCFAGSGVTGTAARARGLDFAGIEAHPLVAELAQLKLRPLAHAEAVKIGAQHVLEQAKQAYADTDTESETDLVLRSFSTDTVRKLVALRSAVNSSPDREAAAYLKWALLGTLRDVAEVKVGWPYQRPGVARKPRYADALARFVERAGVIADDLDSVKSASTAAQVVVGDSTSSASWEALEGRGAACIASPPYLNNFDYADATRLELYFWGAATTWREMCTEVRADMLTATTQQSSVKAKRAALDELLGLPGTDRVSPIVEELATARQARDGRTKEYDQVIPAYFVGIHGVLQHLARYLAPGSTALWLIGDSAPYGVYVDTPALIGECATGVGFEVVDDVPLRVRGNRWSSNADRHGVPLSERLLVLRSKDEGHDASSRSHVSGSWRR